MNRLWSLLFFLVTICGLATFIMAANGIGPLAGAWLPENYSESGKAIDHLWSVVHWICAFIFLLTGFLIGFVIWRYGGKDRAAADYVKGNVSLEIAWSVIPGAILVGLAFYQMGAWSEQRVNRPTIKRDGQTIPKPAMVHVIAKQFGWEFHYPGADGAFDTIDDFWVENVMVVPDDETIVIQLESRDVIHSFFVPKMRFKNDVVPGMIQTAWFEPLAIGELNIVCAELCGWGHYKMNAKLKIKTRSEYQAWLKEQQNRGKPPQLEPYSTNNP